MSSKMLMGDMPELMEDILKHLNNEIYSLYSCALVNRHWCKMSIPILWQDTFSTIKQRRSLFIPIYFSSLGEDEKLVIKECLKEFEINIEFTKPLFDYARFLKVLDIYQLANKVREWIEWMRLKLDNRNLPYLDYRITPLIILLFKLFVENGAILHEFSLFNSELFKFELEIFHSLEQNVQFCSRLQHLSLDIISDFNIENIVKLLKVLAKNTTKISALKLYVCYYHEPKLIHIFLPTLIHFIKSQEQLRKFILDGGDCPKDFLGIISALESQKNTLQEVILRGCIFSAEFEVLNNCKNLETLRILHCDTELLKILDYNISTLEIYYSLIDGPIIVQIFEKVGISLQRLKIEIGNVTWEESLFLEALKSFCPNIIYLYITNIGLSTQLLELIGDLQKLQFLSLRYAYRLSKEAKILSEETKMIRVMQFAKILPSTLQYLDIARCTLYCLLDSFIDILLDHCNAPLKKLLITSISINNEKNTKALIRYCTRIRTLNYVGIVDIDLVKYHDLGYDIRNELEKYVILVPYKHIVINC
ncbi:hypothetical protein C2G38_2192272 [Gigaspora rosea]|uniref:F-box domain-containing protein n=1 Tax=Gigaspora rosea TaxID=44941 RepID=A0A397UZ49_9GLOM|nr:hypothetical protein C2G38_2192272 [Gigaspora rosea]